MLHSKSNEFILVCQHVPLPGCRLAFFFKVIFGNITNIRVPGTRSKNSSGYPGAKLAKICTPNWDRIGIGETETISDKFTST